MMPDSIPQGWKKLDADSNFFGLGKSWAVRDTNQILGGDTIVNRPRAFSGSKSLHISWFAGKGGTYESDDWVWTGAFELQTGDSLIFKALLGNTKGISYYVDSVQIWICSGQTPQSSHTQLSTVKSNLDTTDNDWKDYKFDLSQFSGQIIHIAFRYYIPVKLALWCNIDDMFVGNHSASIGISQINNQLPEKFYLSQNYPNPFNPVTKIEFSIKHETSNVKLIVYDLTGKEVLTLVNEKLSTGNYDVEFDGTNFASGIYFYKLDARGFSQTKRMILTK